MTTILDKLRPEPRDALAASFSEQFEKDHQAGAMTLTASRWPAVLDLPPELKDDWLAHVPAKLPLALHLLGVVPFDNAATPLFERGKDMEIVGQRRLERLGFKIKAVQPRFVHPSMSALAYPDLIATPPDESEEVPVELKVVDAVPDFRDKWAKAPPLPYTLQLMCQMACSGHQRGYIAALVLVWKGLELHLYPFERDAEIIETLERKGQSFLDLIAATSPERLAEVLVEEDSPDSLRAWSRVVNLAKGSTAQFLEPEAVRRVQELHQARLDKRKGEAAEEAALSWLAAHLPPNAENIELLDGWSIKRSVVKTPEKKIPEHIRAARQHVTLKVVKPAGEETGDG